MAMHDVRRRDRQIGGARDEADVDPRMDPDAAFVRLGQDERERIEVGGLPLEIRGARLERAGVIGIGTAAHLHEQRVEAGIPRGSHQSGDRLGRRQRGSQHPQRARFACRLLGRCVRGDIPEGEEGQQRRGDARPGEACDDFQQAA